jgi:antitoxin HicB
MKPQDYEVRIRPLSEEDGSGFFAEVPDLPGCMSDGETPQEALENAYDAITCWMEAATEMGRQIPPPRQMAA